MKEYKKKRRVEEYSMDNAPIKTKKYFNSSERWRGKREIDKLLNQIPNEAEALAEVRFEMEMSQSDECQLATVSSIEHSLSITLQKLGFGWVDIYKCTCENLDLLSDEEILIRAGYL